MGIRVVFLMSLLLWICGTVELWKRRLCLRAHMVNDLKLSDDNESCLPNANVGLWNCGTVKTGA